jgi:hypothetical protein
VFVHKRSILGNTVVIPNETAQDHGLSWAARGLLLYMLSMPTDWRLNERHLIGQSPKGRDHLRQIVRELEAHGYVRRTSIRGRDGTVSHAVWEVWDTRQEPEQMPPAPQTAYPVTENPSMEQTQSQPAAYPRTGNPATDYPATENPSYYKENNLQSEQRTNKSNPLKGPNDEPQRLTPRQLGTNPRAQQTNPRAEGTNPRAMGVNPRAMQEDPEPATLTAVPPASKPKGQRTATTKPRDPFASKVLPAGVVPADLSSCAQLLAQWWAVKGRGRTEGAFKIACNFLRGLEPADRIRSLEKSIMGGYQGLHDPGRQPQRRPDPNPGPPIPVKGTCTSLEACDPETGLSFRELQLLRASAGS